MNKKMNFLTILPFFGSVIILFWLFIKTIKKHIDKRKFTQYFCICIIMGQISFLLFILIAVFLDFELYISEEQFSIAIVVAIILGGYLTNLCTFLLLNKKWEDLITLNTK